MHRLLYTSEATFPHSGEAAHEIVEGIAHAAAARNARNGITGALIFVDNQFIQVLEGHEAQLEETFESICCDLRHENVRLIDLFAIQSRMFGDWKMTCLTDQGHSDIELCDGLQNIRILVGVNAREAMAELSRLLGRRAELARAA